MVEIIALVADPLTQNVFLVTKCYQTNLRQQLATIKSLADKDSTDSKQMREDLIKDILVSLEECRDNVMKVHRNSTINFTNSCNKENINNKDALQCNRFISMEQLMDQLLVLQDTEDCKYLEKSKFNIENEQIDGSCEVDKPKFTIRIDNPLLSKNWKSSKIYDSPSTLYRVSMDIFDQLISYISNI